VLARAVLVQFAMRTRSPDARVAVPVTAFEGPQAPVRDDTALAPGEDLDRALDGAPHSVIGLTALFSVMLAMLVAFMFLTGKRVLMFAAVLLLVIAIPALVTGLRRKAARDRDHLHPSR
jgi:hypothetical protein